MKKFIGVLAILTLLAPTLVMAQKTVSKSFNGIKKVTMNTASGSCKVRKSSDASVKVSVEYTYDENSYDPRMEQEGDKLVIKENFNRNSNSGRSQWTVTIPDDMQFSFSTGSGDLDIADITMDMRARTGSGNLLFTNVKGELDGNTGSGDIELTYASGDLHVNTGSGEIRVEKCSGDLDLNCGSGNIRMTDNQARISANTGSGRIRATNVKLSGSSSFNTGSGSAEVTLGATPKYDLSVNSGSGDATLNFNGNDISGKIVMRYNKRNGNIDAPFAFDTTEEIENGGNGNNVTVEKTVTKGNGTNRIRVSTGTGTAALRK